MTIPYNKLADQLHRSDLVTVDAFLSLQFCRRILLALAETDWEPSRMEAITSATEAAREARTSSTVILEQPRGWLEKAFRGIEIALQTVLGILPSHLEPWQATHYKRGQAYDYHLDCGSWSSHPSGERRRTVMICIEQPVKGGATDFRALHKRIPAVVGRLLVWNNLLANGNCNHAMIHSGCTVWEGRKTILTTWEHERRYIQ